MIHTGPPPSGTSRRALILSGQRICINVGNGDKTTHLAVQPPHRNEAHRQPLSSPLKWLLMIAWQDEKYKYGGFSLLCNGS